jgi:hypothetical protein
MEEIQLVPRLVVVVAIRDRALCKVGLRRGVRRKKNFGKNDGQWGNMASDFRIRYHSKKKGCSLTIYGGNPAGSKVGGGCGD